MIFIDVQFALDLLLKQIEWYRLRGFSTCDTISQTAHVEDSTGSYFAVSYIDPLDGNNYSKLFSAFCNETVNNDTITYIQTVYVSN